MRFTDPPAFKGTINLHTLLYIFFSIVLFSCDSSLEEDLMKAKNTEEVPITMAARTSGTFTSSTTPIDANIDKKLNKLTISGQLGRSGSFSVSLNNINAGEYDVSSKAAIVLYTSGTCGEADRFSGLSGKVTITSITQSMIKGTFSLKVRNDIGTTLAITDGTFTGPIKRASSESTIVPEGAFLFKGDPNTDVTAQLQEFLNKYKNVYIDNEYLISTSLTISSDGSLIGINNASLTASTNTTGLLSSRGTYINLDNKHHVKVSGIKLKQNKNLNDEASWGKTVILINNSSNCLIAKNIFDFSFAYSKGIEAVWITGPSSSNNVISENYIKSLGITYCENGASNNAVEKNQLINSHSNALGGIGNGSKPCTNNKVLNNYIENAGRMGIEDQQNTSGTIIKGNNIQGTGALPGIKTGVGMGISAVAKNTIVVGNKITNAKDYYIEVAGKSNISISDNEIYDTGKEKGIFINFVGKSVTNQTTSIKGNKLVGCLKAIETFGDRTTQSITIEGNHIIDPIITGIDINIGRSVKSSISILENIIIYNTKTNEARYGMVTYTTVASGSQKIDVIVDKNIISYLPSAVGGKGYDIGMIIQFDNAVISNNTINGYSGGLNYGISNNGSITKGVKIIGNTVKAAIWDISKFL